MNTDQINSAVRGALKFVGGILIAHGATKVASFVNAEDVIGLVTAIVGFILSHKWHADEPATPSTGSGTAAKAVAVAFLIGLVGYGCAGSFNSQVFNTERLTADTARNAVHGFNLYYQHATNGASADQIEKLNQTRDQIYQGSKDLAVSLKAVEGLRQSYAENSADTNKAALQIAIAVAESQGSNLWWTAQFFLSSTNH